MDDVDGMIHRRMARRRFATGAVRRAPLPSGKIGQQSRQDENQAETENDQRDDRRYQRHVQENEQAHD